MHTEQYSGEPRLTIDYENSGEGGDRREGTCDAAVEQEAGVRRIQVTQLPVFIREGNMPPQRA